jgi:hypothetical protein
MIKTIERMYRVVEESLNEIFYNLDCNVEFEDGINVFWYNELSGNMVEEEVKSIKNKGLWTENEELIDFELLTTEDKIFVLNEINRTNLQ